MKRIKLTQGKFALVDDDDFERLNAHKWHYHVYAMRSTKEHNGWRMHWEVIGKPEKGLEVDHINRDKLDNRKCNLRIATHSQNQRNKTVKTNKSGISGVCWYEKKKKWLAQAYIDKKKVYLGLFTDKFEAGRAYQQATLNK